MSERREEYRAVFFYLVFGVLTTAVNIAVYAFCYGGEVIPGLLTIRGLGMENVPSTVAAWVAAVVFAYLTNKLWVFEARSFAPKDLLAEMGKFFGCRLVTGLMDLLIMWVGVDLLGGPATLLKAGSNVLVVVLNYIFSKCVVFRRG